MLPALIRIIVILIILNLIKILFKNLISSKKQPIKKTRINPEDVINAKFTHVKKDKNEYQ